MAVVELGLGAVGERHRRAVAALGDLGTAGAAARLVPCAVGTWLETGSLAGKESASRSSLVVVILGRKQVLQSHPERGLGLGQRDPVLGALGPGDARHDGREVELDLVAERRLLGVLVVPEPLLLGVGLDQLDQLAWDGR